MPQKSAYTPILGGNYYHIYNRANNSMRLFYTERNYNLFLRLLINNLTDYCEILAYCLIPNHFHIMIRTTDKLKVEEEGKIREITDLEVIGERVSEQFRKMFIFYAQTIKIQEDIKGSIFQKPFKRVLIENEKQFLSTIFYIHYNPAKHEVQEDFRTFRYSSYIGLTTTYKTNLSREHVIKIFGDVHSFINYHEYFWEVKKELALE